jgi:hypothetical protein
MVAAFLFDLPSQFAYYSNDKMIVDFSILFGREDRNMQGGGNMNNFEERRQHRRYPLKDVAFAILRTNADEELGQIVNISLGGLAFQYFVGNRNFQKAEKLDVFLADNGIHVDDIPFQVVDDYEMANELPFSSITKREQRVRFDSLTDLQISGIKEFIKGHTVLEQ